MEVNINGKDYEVVPVGSQQCIDEPLLHELSQRFPQHYPRELYEIIKRGIVAAMDNSGAIETDRVTKDGVVTFKAKAYVLLPKQDANRLHQTPQE